MKKLLMVMKRNQSNEQIFENLRPYPEFWSRGGGGGGGEAVFRGLVWA